VSYKKTAKHKELENGCNYEKVYFLTFFQIATADPDTFFAVLQPSLVIIQMIPLPFHLEDQGQSLAKSATSTSRGNGKSQQGWVSESKGDRETAGCSFLQELHYFLADVNREVMFKRIIHFSRTVQAFLVKNLQEPLQSTNVVVCLDRGIPGPLVGVHHSLLVKESEDYLIQPSR
jgi:hypothetical protein